MVIVWTDNAKKHLRSIFDYYKVVAGKNTAIQIVSNIINAAQPLSNFHELAPIESALIDYPQHFRSLATKDNYKLVYYISDRIYIIAVWDCRRNPKIMKTLIGRSLKAV
ncbi:MAG: type II toxin-antitoxin system RelE/ParE family toxin [Bacteroidales bacterium]|jgi:plasmid stabilization system protein ParE|nr:type II toxin-antitoxin system RelE/ParE family toxin [Bacteroidales bacterium]